MSSLSFCVLGSGSGGNCTLVICGPADDAARRRCFLIDCGLSPRAVNQRLATLNLGLTIDGISAIVLTHFDTDHFYPGWLRMLHKRAAAGRPITIHLHHRHRQVAWRAGLTARDVALFNGSLSLDCGVRAETVLLAHDDLGSVGFVFDFENWRLGFATDLGCVSDALLDSFVNLNALALESNYDREMQMNSGRPAFLKRRIMGGAGHLSNAQALEAVYRIAECSRLSQVALLHLSRECNCPKLLRRLYEREAAPLLPQLTITNQFEPTALLPVQATKGAVNWGPPQLGVRRARQLTLF